MSEVIPWTTRPKGFRSYAHLAGAMLAAAATTRYMDTLLAGSAEELSRTVVKESEMATDDADNELIVGAVRDFQRGCLKLERAILEDPDGYPETIEFLEKRIIEVRALCDFMLPPRDCFPPNVVPFVPRRTG